MFLPLAGKISIEWCQVLTPLNRPPSSAPIIVSASCMIISFGGSLTSNGIQLRKIYDRLLGLLPVNLMEETEQACKISVAASIIFWSN